MNGGDIKYKFNGGSAVTHYNGAASATSDVYEFLFDADNGYFDVKENGSAFGTQLTGIPLESFIGYARICMRQVS